MSAENTAVSDRRGLGGPNASYSDDLQTVSHFKVLRVSPDGSYAKIDLGNWTGDQTYLPAGGTACTGTFAGLGDSPLHIITNAGTGEAVFSLIATGDGCTSAVTWLNQISYVSQNGLGSQVNLPTNVFVQPVLQREDGSYIGSDWTNNLYAIGPDGSLVWQQQVGPALSGGDPYFPLTPLTPLYVTADGGVIVTSTRPCPHRVVTASPCTSSSLGTLYTLDSSGNITSQTSDTGAVYSWIGQAYYVPPSGGAISGLPLPGVSLAGSFAAISEGNHSGNGVAIDQVQTPFPQGEDETPPASNAATDLFNYGSNYSAVEILTDATPDYIFQNYVQKYAGVRELDHNSVGYVPQNTNVTGAGQEVTFTLKGLPSLGQGPFKVRMKAFDATAHIMAVVTLKGHPLFGRRYWRVFSIGAGDVVVETGAIDAPACQDIQVYQSTNAGCLNYWGYYIFGGQQTKIWAHELQYILDDLNLRGIIAQRGRTPAYNYLDGKWGWDVSFRSNYLWPNLCYDSACQ